MLFIIELLYVMSFLVSKFNCVTIVTQAKFDRAESKQNSILSSSGPGPGQAQVKVR